MFRAMTWTASELMTVNAARLLRDGEVVIVGVGLPNLACNLAARTHAPNLVLLYEAGVVGSRPRRLPLSIGDPTLVSGAVSVCSMYELFANYLQRGNVDVGFLGGAQIDRYGNINATVIGEYDRPRTRLPGSGGAMEIAAWARRCYVITPHERRRFPERVDFVTSAGCRTAGDAGPPGRGLGPKAVVTDLGILEPDETGELVLTALHPGATVEEARARTGWELGVRSPLAETGPPTATELDVLRRLDPERVYLGR